MEKKESTFDRKFKLITLFFVVACLIIMCLPYVMVNEEFLKGANFLNSGEIGDTIGGIMGPFIAMIAAFLTFLAFWMQYKANKAQSDQFKKQADDIATERFENKYYDLIKIQRENTNNVNNKGQFHGKLAFSQYFYELRFLYHLIQDTINEEALKKNETENFNSEDKFQLAYMFFYIGVNPNFTENKFLISQLSRICNSQSSISIIMAKIMGVQLRRNLNSGKLVTDGPEMIDVRINDYIPFSGHSSELGVYFRHLFHIIKFVDKTKFKENIKFNYIRTLRAQLSDFEQILLHFHCASMLGESWKAKENDFIKKYRLIKNIPLTIIDFGPNLIDYYSSEIIYWRNKGERFFEFMEE